nr:hypothetical protein [uncultured Phycicoccus sp.]
MAGSTPPGTVATIQSAGTATSSACAPNRPSQYPNTVSPGANPTASDPTCSTTPAYSVPHTGVFGPRHPEIARMNHGRAARYPQSVRLTVLVCTRTRRSAGPGTGSGTSVTMTTSGGP